MSGMRMRFSFVVFVKNIDHKARDGGHAQFRFEMLCFFVAPSPVGIKDIQIAILYTFQYWKE